MRYQEPRIPAVKLRARQKHANTTVIDKKYQNTDCRIATGFFVWFLLLFWWVCFLIVMGRSKAISGTEPVT